jgi:hypothetical protein
VRVTLIPSFRATCSQIQCEDQYFACVLNENFGIHQCWVLAMGREHGEISRLDAERCQELMNVLWYSGM